MAFDPFGDHATAGYLRNVLGERDPEHVKRLEHRAFAGAVQGALKALKLVKQLGYQDVLDTNRRLFASLYPWAGQDRATLAPELAIGKGGRFDLFSHPGDVKRAVEYGLDMGRDPNAMRRKPGEVLGTLAYAHPFLETNGRTIVTVHTEMARRADFHVAWENISKPAFLAALTEELRRPGTALDALLLPQLRAGPLPTADTAGRLAANPSINPVGRPAGPTASPGP